MIIFKFCKFYGNKATNSSTTAIDGYTGNNEVNIVKMRQKWRGGNKIKIKK